MLNTENKNREIASSLTGKVKQGSVEEYETVLMSLERKKGRTKEQAVANVTGHNKVLAQYFKSINALVEEQVVDEVAKKFSEKDLKDFILSHNESYKDRTPEDIINLAKKILDVNAGESVIDLCCGTGNFALSCAKNVPDASYSGYDISTDKYLLSEIRRIVSGSDIKFNLGNVFDLPEKGIKADKIFASYPFRMDLMHGSVATEYIKNKIRELPFLSAGASDWIFNILIMDLLKDSGKAVALMPLGDAFNGGAMEKVRKYFAEEGYIEAEILLPAGLFYDMSIPALMVVLSRNNSSIRMIDASEEYKKDGRNNRLTDKNIEKIYEAYEKGNDLSEDAGLSDIRTNNFNLSVKLYTEKTPDIPNGRPLEEVTKDIVRGARLSAKDLDTMKSEKVTGYQYMELSDITDGIIEKDLSYLNISDDRYDKFCIKDKDLIISKIAVQGSSMKVAVAEVPEGRKIIAAGNLYIISVDQDVLDPYYLKAFLESSLGVVSLQRASTGTVIPSLSIQNLKDLIVPVPPMDEQKKFVDEYLISFDEVGVLKTRLKKAEDKLYGLFDSQEVM